MGNGDGGRALGLGVTQRTKHRHRGLQGKSSGPSSAAFTAVQPQASHFPPLGLGFLS